MSLVGRLNYYRASPKNSESNLKEDQLEGGAPVRGFKRTEQER